MKLQVNFDGDKKVAKIEENVKMRDLICNLEKLFPDGSWKDFELETNTTIYNWRNPVFIERSPTYPAYPYWWYSDSTPQTVPITTSQTVPTTFNFEVEQ